MSENQTVTQPNTHTTVVVNQIQKKGNGLGVAGFVLALLGLFLCWVPVLGWILWILGLIFSIIGLFKTPRGMAIAGLIISLIDIILLTVLIGAIMSAF